MILALPLLFAVAAATPTKATGRLSQIKTVFVILMENRDWAHVEGSASAPYLNELLKQGAHAKRYLNLPGLHPSEPNYLWLEAGTNFGVGDDAPPSINHQASTAHLTALLEKAGKRWRSYQEGIDGQSCPLFPNGLYAPRHNPAVFFDDNTGNQDPASRYCIAHVRPFGELAADLQNGNVGDYNFITPNLCHDMHNAIGCASSDQVKNGDDWLRAELPQLLASAPYKNGGAIFITWDESEGEDVPIGLILMSPFARKGYASQRPFDHSALLRTVEAIFGLSPWLGGAAKADDLADLLR